jgi:hypothetical protein
VIDSNGLPSAGLFQFQYKTFASFAVQYGLVAKKETAKYWRDPHVQRSLAEKMIADGIASKHWVICYSKYQRSKAV